MFLQCQFAGSQSQKSLSLKLAQKFTTIKNALLLHRQAFKTNHKIFNARKEDKTNLMSPLVNKTKNCSVNNKFV